MDRREFVHHVAGIAGVAAAATLPGVIVGCAKAQPARHPNIVLIMSDDLGYGDLGVTGRSDYATPNIDQIARDGVLLTQAYSAAPVCTPTRVALMTGRFPARTHAGLFEPLTTHPTGLPPAPLTLSGLLKNAGYETSLVGKWHLGVLPEFHPLRHGFDDFYGFLGAAADYRSHIDTEYLTPQFFDGTEPVRADGYLTDLFTARAVEIVKRQHSKPFFLNLQYNAPHWPWQAPGDPPYPDSLRWVKGGSPEIYGRMVARMDDGVGQLMAALRERGLERDTLVIFTSDNGGERFSHMGPFSQGKMTLNEGGIRVAAMARWPGKIAAGSKTDQVAVTMDLSATMLALAGARPDANAPLDGIDLLPALAGGLTRDRDLYWRISQRRKQKALRSGDSKYLQNEAGEFLFDLAADPGEKNDLKTAQPQRFAELRQKYASWEKEVLQPIPLEPKYA